MARKNITGKNIFYILFDFLTNKNAQNLEVLIWIKLNYLKNCLEIAGKKEGETAAEEDPEAAAELAEARRLEEERRRAKYAKMENEREKTRVGIREKVNYYFILFHY